LEKNISIFQKEKEWGKKQKKPKFFSSVAGKGEKLLFPNFGGLIGEWYSYISRVDNKSGLKLEGMCFEMER